MLDMGFREDLEFILETTPAERRTLLFSATLPKPIVTLAKHYQRDALRIAASEACAGPCRYRIPCRAHRRPRDGEHAVVNLLRYYEARARWCSATPARPCAICKPFCRSAAFRSSPCRASSGRANAIRRCRRCATGVRASVSPPMSRRAASICRASTSSSMPNCPNDAEVLQHRSGRTGRAGRKGISVLLITPQKRRRAEMLLAQAAHQSGLGRRAFGLCHQGARPGTPAAEPGADRTGQRRRSRTGTPSIGGAAAEQIATALVRLHRAHLPAPEELADPGRGAAAARPCRAAQGFRVPQEDARQPHPRGPHATRGTICAAPRTCRAPRTRRAARAPRTL